MGSTELLLAFPVLLATAPELSATKGRLSPPLLKVPETLVTVLKANPSPDTKDCVSPPSRRARPEPNLVRYLSADRGLVSRLAAGCTAGSTGDNKCCVVW